MKWTIYSKIKQHIPWQAIRPSQVQDQMGPDMRDKFWRQYSEEKSTWAGHPPLSNLFRPLLWPEHPPTKKTTAITVLRCISESWVTCVRSNLVRAENIFVTPNDSNADQQCDVLDCLSTTGWRYNWRQRYKFPTTTSVTWQNTTIVTHFAL